MIDDPSQAGETPADHENDELFEEADETAPERDAAAVLASELAATKDQLLRTLAELENTRRRARKDVEEAGKFAIASFARECLSIADNLARALGAVPPEARGQDDMLKALLEGVELTERELMALFERQGMRRIDPKGERFDPNLHQAMFEVPAVPEQDGQVVQVVQPGYTLSGRLLRPALVGVAKAANGGEKGLAERGSRLDTSA
jgi:molecular chaperone GrpE